MAKKWEKTVKKDKKIAKKIQMPTEISLRKKLILILEFVLRCFIPFPLIKTTL